MLAKYGKLQCLEVELSNEETNIYIIDKFAMRLLSCRLF